MIAILDRIALNFHDMSLNNFSRNNQKGRKIEKENPKYLNSIIIFLDVKVEVHKNSTEAFNEKKANGLSKRNFDVEDVTIISKIALLLSFLFPRWNEIPSMERESRQVPKWVGNLKLFAHTAEKRNVNALNSPSLLSCQVIVNL